MRKIVLLITIGVIFTFKLEAKKIEGKIFFEHDTMDVIFNIPVDLITEEPNFESLQQRVKYYDSEGKKHILRPDDAKEYRFKSYHREIRMISRKNTLESGRLFSTGNNIFLRLQVDGYLKLFNYYFTRTTAGTFNGPTGAMNSGTSYSSERYVLQKGDDVLKRTKGLNFKKDMQEYFSDCPKLAEKIENKEFRQYDLRSIVRFYNSQCR
jgi:hypothetical protein